MRPARTALAACAALVLGATAAAAGSGLVRLTDRDDLLGWEAVGRLDMAGSGFCSGTLIAPDLVLTAAHCVHDPRSGEMLQAGRLTFRAGLRDGVSIADRGVAQIAVPAGYAKQRERTMDKVRADVALLRLSAPILSGEADPFVLHDGAAPGGAVSVASYGQGRSEALSRQRSCQVVAAADDLMAFDCDVTFGSSGAPVFVKTGSRVRIVSVISGMAEMSGRQVAIGMALPAVVAGLKADLRRDAAAARPAASARRIRVGGGGGDASGAKFVRP